jgi:hypothetical protein
MLQILVQPVLKEQLVQPVILALKVYRVMLLILVQLALRVIQDLQVQLVLQAKMA